MSLRLVYLDFFNLVARPNKTGSCSVQSGIGRANLNSTPIWNAWPLREYSFHSRQSMDNAHTSTKQEDLNLSENSIFLA